MPLMPGLFLCCIGLALVVGPVVAFEASSARLGGLERSLRATDDRLRHAPRAGKVDLDRAARHLRVLELERPRDPRLGRLRQQIQDQRWDADRVIRRARGRALPPPGFGATVPAVPPPKIGFGPGGPASLDRTGSRAADRAVR